MYFLTNDSKKVNIGWTAKCGCTFVKKIFFYLSNTIVEDVHKKSTQGLIKKYDYTNIIISRNPYQRLVSGFLDKFRPYDDGVYNYFRENWERERGDITINFINLVKFLGNWKIIDEHHFTQQLSEAWHDDIRVDYVFDISNINYSILENIFDKKLPANILKDIHKNKNFANNLDDKNKKPKLYLTPIEKIFNLKCSYNQFYNSNLKIKVYNFYKKDFDFFQSHGLFYDIDI